MADGRWDTIADLEQAKESVKIESKRRKVTRKPNYAKPLSMEATYKFAQAAVEELLSDYKRHTDDELHEAAMKVLGAKYKHLRYRAVNSVVLHKNAPNPLYELDDRGGKLYWTKQHI